MIPTFAKSADVGLRITHYQNLQFLKLKTVNFDNTKSDTVRGRLAIS